MGLLDRISFAKRDADPPEAIDVGPAGELRVVWPGGAEATLAPLLLRDACPCAACIEEGTGRKLLDPSTIPADIRPLELVPIGNYAVQIRWSDGHATGIYSWNVLRDLSRLAGEGRR